MMGSLYVCVMLMLLGSVIAADNDICTREQLEKCSTSFYVLTKVGRRSMVPVNEQELLAHCEKQKAAAECLRNRTEICDSGLTKGAMRIVFDDNQEEYSRRCDPTSKEFRNFLSVAPCLNTIGHELYGCVANFTTQLTSLSTVKALRDKIDYACCFFESFEKCAFNSAANRCGSSTRDFLDGYLGQTVREITGLLCTGDSSICADLKPVEINKDFDFERDGPQSIFAAIHYIVREAQKKP